MFSVNLLSVTIWILGGVLLLIALGIVLWRGIFGKKHKKSFENKNIGQVSKEFNEFLIQLKSVSDFWIIHNILIKNKFSSKKFSIIPAIIFSNGNAFLLTNVISSKKYERVEFSNNEKNPSYINGVKKVKITWCLLNIKIDLI